MLGTMSTALPHGTPCKCRRAPASKRLPSMPQPLRASSCPRRSVLARAATAEKQAKEPAKKPVKETKEVAPLAAVKTEEKDKFSDSVMMQGFGWDACKKKKHGGWYKIVQDNLDRIKDLGVDIMWLPPPSASVAPQGYMPGQLYDLDTPFGNKEQLTGLLKACKEKEITTLADIVINHRCADEQDDQGHWNIFTDKIEHEGRSIAWGPWAIVRGDGYAGEGVEDTGDDYDPAPDLDHTNEAVKGGLTDWLNWLHKDIGYDGWRLDYVKGYGADIAGDYIRDTIGESAFCVGEYWTDMDWRDSGLAYDQDGARQALCDYINRAGKVLPLFDFPTKGILQEAVQNQLGRLKDKDNNPPGLLGWWPAGAVTFLDNHDTGSTQQHWPFPSDKIMEGYAYILTHPGLPCILWEHAFDWGLMEELKTLVELRRRSGITRLSTVMILAAEDDIYIAKINDTEGNARLLLKLGTRRDMGEHSASSNWKIAATGHNYAVWERA